MVISTRSSPKKAQNAPSNINNEFFIKMMEKHENLFKTYTESKEKEIKEIKIKAESLEAQISSAT